MADPSPAILEPRPFEASFIGGPVFAVNDPTYARDAVDWAKGAGCRLLSCRSAVGEGKALGSAGFRKIEELATYARPLNGAAPTEGAGWTITTADAGDIPACRAIAAAALRSDRFHADRRIDAAAADALKAAWIENSIRGRADCVLLVLQEGAVAGFNAVILHAGKAVIDLIAVSPKFQGKGAGGALIAAALKRYDRVCGEIRVGTQASNRPAIHLYEKWGFEEVERSETWHWTP